MQEQVTKVTGSRSLSWWIRPMRNGSDGHRRRIRTADGEAKKIPHADHAHLMVRDGMSARGRCSGEISARDDQDQGHHRRAAALLSCSKHAASGTAVIAESTAQ